MGNNSSKNDYSERFPLDDNSSVAVLRKSKSYKELKVVETWSAEYLLDGRSSCELELAKSKHEQELSISIHDRALLGHSEEDVDFEMNVRVKEDLLLANVTLNGPKTCMQQLPERKTPTLQGGVLKSSSFLYGRDSHRKGLIVISRRKRSDEDQELPYAITVKHYFVAETCSNGVSVVAHIRSDGGDGALTVQLEKPSTQPKRDMLSMFHHFQQHSQTTDSASYFNGNVIDSYECARRYGGVALGGRGYECARRYGGVALGGGGGGGGRNSDLRKIGSDGFELLDKMYSRDTRGRIDYWNLLPEQISIPTNADPFSFHFANLAPRMNAPKKYMQWYLFPLKLLPKALVWPSTCQKIMSVPSNNYKPPDMGIIPNPNRKVGWCGTNPSSSNSLPKRIDNGGPFPPSGCNGCMFNIERMTIVINTLN